MKFFWMQQTGNTKENWTVRKLKETMKVDRQAFWKICSSPLLSLVQRLCWRRRQDAVLEKVEILLDLDDLVQVQVGDVLWGRTDQDHQQHFKRCVYLLTGEIERPTGGSLDYPYL